MGLLKKVSKYAKQNAKHVEKHVRQEGKNLGDNVAQNAQHAGKGVEKAGREIREHKEEVMVVGAIVAASMAVEAGLLACGPSPMGDGIMCTF